MADLPILSCPELERDIWRMYRDFFDKAERRRRWRIADDIPWNECNRNLDPAVADVIETFCAVELYLPDYTGKILPVVRPSKGRTWFYANWGYEESKHSLALNDWLVKSGHRSDEYMTDMESKVFEREWNLPTESHVGMLCYAMSQELATFINYRNLKNRIAALGGDPALEKLLGFISIDERAHYSFFRDATKIFLTHDREGTIAQLRPILNQFQMPAVHDLLDESTKRIERIRNLEVFNEEIFYREVYFPIITDLGITKAEMRGKPIKKSYKTDPNPSTSA
ncbi:acyl-ACP desaturase [Tuwongella immobilis]|uniref:Acyl-ACP desaturase n=1 Tax=Tuwongella immobilis TaxID=692036 RepID=A0A6C2YTT8_9BACT|nr:acyl-ACP desaturase [Tuwongella immobilis]VIP04543.1 acyl-acp desaturase : Acyl-ACP desaturase OS=Sorangium cellulosum So0157-2 GN=SCE1572_15120 PE=4 SV=1: FA_desaturase_2 [Tuwongella immobilis]VTS06447.1 acyl-acp desaturase : Acyl-ACP desaturase OS=Sorangium cellulosum So0157-2 GN=SCE1572_15120 PE=4 SV=1: FA_desaturase_2 [Tuwongella immobilis]